MAASHNIAIKKLLKDFGALPTDLVAQYLTIKFKDESNMTLNLAKQTIYAAVREFACCQKDSWLLADNNISIDSSVISGARAFRVYLEFMEYIPGGAFCRPSSPWLLSFIAGDVVYYVVSISRGSEYQTGALLNSFSIPEEERVNYRRIGILENNADLSLVPYCGIMQFAVVDSNWDLDVYSPEDRDTIEKAWADVQTR